MVVHRGISLSLFLLASAVTSLSCVTRSTGDRAERTANFPHLLGAGGVSPQSWQWRNLTEDQYHAVVVPGFSPRLAALTEANNGFLPNSHPIVTRLQGWQDRIDHRMRERYPDLMKNVPIPKLKVVKSSGIHAFAAPVMVCYQNVVLVINPGAKVNYASGNIRLDVVQDLSGQPCLPGSIASEEELKTLVQFYNNNNKTCRIEIGPKQQDTYILLAKSTEAGKCAAQQTKEKIGRIDVVAGVAMQNWLTYSSGLVDHFSEDEVLAVMTHELAHFYRGHFLSHNHPQRLDFFYQIDDTNPVVIRQPDGNLSTFQEQYRQAVFALDQAELLWNLNQGSAPEEENSRRYAAWEKSARKLEEGLIQKREELKALTAEAQQKNIGRYTLEQEADELSLELLASTGIDPKAMINTYLVQNDRLRQDSQKSDLVNCRRLFDANWQEDGRIKIPLAGNLEDAYQTPCFRIFNLALELEAHRDNYKEYTTIEAKKPSEVSWNDLQQMARNESGSDILKSSPSDAGSVIFAESWKRLGVMLSCPFFPGS